VCDVISFAIKSNVASMMQQTISFAKSHAPLAAVKAMTFTAMEVKKAEITGMQGHLQNPTRYTLNGMYVARATLPSPSASVYFKDFAGKGVPAGRYLYPQIHGGSRVAKSSERRMMPLMAGHKFFMPGAGAVQDMHGNIKGAVFSRILAQVRLLDQGQNTTKGSAKRSKRRGADQYFIPRPGHGLAPAVYKRVGRGVIPVLVFANKANYRPRFPFYSIAETSASHHFPIIYNRLITKAMHQSFK
jgi:hypothetical protein